ncbi:acyltransferase [Rhizocola hellebori]|uniref:Acyltransferase n=1 Tax=Rhizocola hellebori TaxID=1392758 RepID=A0A8J3Q993_9ACTN|nr:acyltransferase [Rhizocola hellebori]GIH06270.1 acyltransferase [Rhizocola hellebori]
MAVTTSMLNEETVALPVIAASSKPASPPRLPALDALRAVGAIAVVTTHVGFNTGVSLDGVWGGFLARLDVGVAVFFTLSGFLLFRPFAHAAATGGERPGFRRYLWRRALRILPAYWLAVVAYLLLLWQTSPVTTSIWIKNLALLQVYDGSYPTGFVHTWSLCTEVAFYLVLPLIAGLTLRGRWRPTRVVILLACLGLAATAGWFFFMFRGLISYTPQGHWLPSFAGWFAAGMILAVASVALRTGTAPRCWRLLDELGATPLACWTIAFAVLVVAATPLAGARDLNELTPAEFATKQVLYLAAALMLLTGLAFGPENRFKRAFSAAPSRWLGTISYGLFLWHPFVLAAIYRPGGREPFTGSFVSTYSIVLAAGIVLGAASYYLVEHPLHLLDRAARRR